MVLVNQAQGYRVCLECHEVLRGGEEEEKWLAVHLGADGCRAERRWWPRRRKSGRR